MDTHKESPNTLPYCPNPKCFHHKIKEPGFDEFYKSGFRYRKTFPFKIQRFQCKQCLRIFSDSTFELGVYDKRQGLNPLIFERLMSGSSNRQIAKNISCSEHLVRVRISKMAKFALLEHSRKLHFHKISEPLVYDGLENFAKSQYDPNNINQVLGSNSLFMYDFSFAPLNRKGRISPRQLKKKEEIEQSIGIYPRNAIRKSTTDLFARMFSKWDTAKYSQMKILSDEHFQYRRSVNIDLAKIQIEHVTISSKESRTYKNMLFPINHADMMIRHNIKAFTRETVAFSKTPIAMVNKYILFMVWKNYMRTKFVKAHKEDPKSNSQSPAQFAKIETKILKFFDFFSTKFTQFNVELSNEWYLFFQGSVPHLRAL